ncbi:MAG TPA: nuclear transport factor 2 family protein [Xanthobacteraceae bacterium]|nr:nuclear transport factor 2 family protein [Xanthobacteraceae bacterium]
MIGRVCGRLGVALVAAALAGSLAAAQTDDQAQADIRAALMKWTADFNARNLGEVCDLFAPDLRYDYQGFPERGFDDICKLLRQSLADSRKRYSYAPPAITDILVSGDLAVVRLTWTLTVKGDAMAQDVTTQEPGIDIFRKQPDGRWQIIRFIAYTAS